MRPTIRPSVDATDRPGLIALYRAAWHAAYDAIDGAETIDRLIDALLAGEPPEIIAMPAGDVALVALRDDCIIGGVRAHPRSDGVHLSGMYVRPGLQRSGVGSALLAGLVARFPAGTVWRADVRPQSAGALRFYGRHGFVEIGRARGDVGGGHWVDVIELRRV